MNPSDIITSFTVLTFLFGFIPAYSQNYLLYLFCLLLTCCVSYVFPNYDHLTKN